MFTLQKKMEVRVMWKGIDTLNSMLDMWGIGAEEEKTATQPIDRLLLPVMGAIQNSLGTSSRERLNVMQKLQYVRDNADRILQLAKENGTGEKNVYTVLEGTYKESTSGYSITTESMRSLIKFTRLIFQKVDKALT